MVSNGHRSRALRIVAPAGGILLAAAATLVPATVTADGHQLWSPVQGVLQAMQEERFEDIAAFFCEEQRPTVEALDFSTALSAALPGGASADDLSEALVWTAELASATPVDPAFPPPDEAELEVAGSVYFSLDPDMALEALEEILAGGGSETVATFESFSEELEASRRDFSEVLTVIRPEPGGSYLICSDFAALAAIAGPATEEDGEPDVS